MIQGYKFIRDLQYKIYIEEFMVSSLLAILGIRVFLKLTNYPRLGGETLHISHMLWGGLLMFTALIILLTFINTGAKRIATNIGGLGFGGFIDELGKFITRDNNYFFQPTFALIYIFFIILYLVLQLIDNKKEFTQKEYLTNSIELMKDAVINDLDTQEKKTALAYLNLVDSNDKIAKTLKELYTKIDAIAQTSPSIITIIRREIRNLYKILSGQNWFQSAIIIFFVGQGLVSIIYAFMLLTERNVRFIATILTPLAFPFGPYNLYHLFSTLTSFVFILIGIMTLYRSRLRAYEFFKRSILVSILLSQVFAFYYTPVTAFIGLVFQIAMLTTLNYMITLEKSIKA